MNKRIIVEVSCANQFASDIPQVCTFTVTQAMADRIRSLAETVVSLGVYAIEDFDYSGTWSSIYLDSMEVNSEHGNLNGVVELIEGSQCSVDIPTLRVTNDHFHFTAVPNNGSDDLTLSTRPIAIKELDSDKPYVKV